jgi:hypothetical protein
MGSALRGPAHPPEQGQRCNVVQGVIICTVGIHNQAAQGCQAGQQGRCVWIQTAVRGTKPQGKSLNLGMVMMVGGRQLQKEGSAWI